jgi:DNA primase
VSVVDEVRARTDIVELVSQYVPLTKSGRSFKARCPFHQERTPSFLVNPDRQTWHCFGACGTGGDAFSFVMRAENVDFREALRRLADRAGIALQAQPEAERQEEARGRLYAALEAATLFYANLLLTAPAGAPARAHLSERGMERATWEAYQLGYSPSAWDALSKHLLGKGFSVDELKECGLVAARESGGVYDRFRNRLVIPIRDARGRTVGFGARLLAGEGPKYINSPATELFDKSASLYGIDRAQKAIRAADQAVIVEGYFDVLAAHQAGLLDVVGSMGTAITPKQIAGLKRLTKNLVLALDPDAAGEEATLRGIEVAREAFDRSAVPVPTWQGLVRYHSALDASIRILELPRGVDPDELVRRDAAEWRALVAAARPVTDYLFDAVTGRLDLSRSKDKSRAVERLLPVVREIGDPVQQAHYLQRLSRLVQVDERTLAGAVARVRNRRPENSPAEHVTEPAPATFRDVLEEYLVALLLTQPALRARISELQPERFESAAAREMLSNLGQIGAKRLDIDDPDNLNFGGKVRLPEMDEGAAEKAFADALRRLNEQRLRRSLRSLAAMQSEAEGAGEELAARDLAQQTVAFSKALGEMHREQLRPGMTPARFAGRTRRP